MLKRVPGSERTREALSDLISGRLSGAFGRGELVQLATRLIVEEGLEAEVRDALGRDYHERGTEAGGGYRNGQRKGRLKTAEGLIEYAAPQVASRDEAFRSELRDHLKGHTEALESLAIEMLARGLSVRDIEDAFKAESGRLLLSRTAVSELGERLWADYQNFATRDLSKHDIAYLFVDGIAERIRPGQRRKPVLAAWGFTTEGKKVLLSLMAGSQEDAETVSVFFQEMRARDLGDPLLVASDGAPRIIKSIETCFPRSTRQRCLAHRMRNLAAKVPEDLWPDFKARVQAAYQAPSRAIAHDLAEGLVADYEATLPSAATCFLDDFEACIAHLRLPVTHRRATRTTNLLERLFLEERGQSDPNPPAKADVVVIGGGIVGVCTAYFLARSGVEVALLEKGRIGAEQSSRNWGWCRQMNRDARELGLASRSLELWEEMQAETGEDLGFSRCGLLYLSDDAAELEGWSSWCTWTAGEGIRTEVLTSAQATQRAAASGRPWKGGIVSPTDGIADPSVAAPGIARGIQQHGGTIHQFCAARGLEKRAVTVSGVITEHGIVETQPVVLAGGAWTSSFCRQLGISMPQSAVRSSILSIAPVAAKLPAAVHTQDVSLTRRSAGGYTLAISGLAQLDPTPQSLRYMNRFFPMFLRRRVYLKPGGLQAFLSGHESRRRWDMAKPTPMERTRILDPRPDRKAIEETLRRARLLFPELGSASLQNAWAGYIDSTPDGVPVIDEVEPGFILAAGMSGHGFGIGPGVGQMVADLAQGKSPALPHRAYSLVRLQKGALEVAGI